VSSPGRGLIVLDSDGAQDWAAAVGPRGGIVEGKNGSVIMCDFNSIVTLQPLRERIKSLPPDGASSESTGVSNQLSIEDEGEAINIGGVILKKKDTSSQQSFCVTDELMASILTGFPVTLG